MAWTPGAGLSFSVGWLLKRGVDTSIATWMEVAHNPSKVTLASGPIISLSTAW